ncbi:Glycosyl transferases group 1 [anaerobic digester metagenome]
MLRSHYPDTRLEREARTLVKLGYNVTLLVWDRGKISKNQQPCPYQIKKLKLSVSPDSLKVCFYLPIWWLYVIFQLAFEQWDVVHAADFDTFAPAFIVAKATKKPTVYDIFDFYSDMIRFPIFPKIFRAFFARTDRFLMRFADVIILPDNSRREQIGSSDNEKIVTIINAPSDVFPESSLVQDIISKNFTIFYGGNISDDRGIDSICQAVGSLSGVKLVIKGPCSETYEGKLKSICQNASNIKLFLRWTPHEEIIRQTASADMLFAFYDLNVPNNKYASPNKLFEAMMCTKPILVNDGTSMAQIVEEEGCGLVVPYGDINAIKRGILTLKNDPRLCKCLGENGRKAYETKYSWSIMEGRLLEVYKQLDPEQRGADTTARSSSRTARNRF